MRAGQSLRPPRGRKPGGDAVEQEAEPEAELLVGGGTGATVTDAFGRASTVHRRDGAIRLPVSLTPLFVSEPPRG